jgi:CheY-like chemotaxis protein
MSSRVSPQKKYSILLCEDQAEFATELQQQLSPYYEIEYCNALPELINRLAEKGANNTLPDILLLDLYWKKSEAISDDARETVSQAAKDFWDKYLEDLKAQVNTALAPHALMYLSLIREKYGPQSLPIMVYTRAGPYILEEYQIEQVYANNATFLIKYYDAALKNYLIRRCIARDRLEYDVFISYASKDRHIALELHDNLCKDNIDVFMSEKTIAAGDAWTERVRTALIASRLIVIVLTPNSLESQWVMAEAGAGWALRKQVVPVTMLVDASNVPVVISQFQMRRFETETEKKEFIKELKDVFLQG